MKYFISNQFQKLRKLIFFFYLLRLIFLLNQNRYFLLSQNENFILAEFLFNPEYVNNLSENEFDHFDNLLSYSTKDRRSNYISYTIHREGVFYYGVKNVINKKRLKSEIVSSNIILQDVSHLVLDIFKFKFSPDYYVIKEKISCYSNDPEYDFLSFSIIHFIHENNIEKFLINFENDRLEYPYEIQKIIDKAKSF